MVNVTSVKGRLPVLFSAAYAITKYGGESFSDILRLEINKFGVNVSIVEPCTFGMATDCLVSQRESLKFLFTSRARSTMEGPVFTGVCLLTFRGWGVGVHCPMSGGYPIQVWMLGGEYSISGLGWGVPHPDLDGVGGTPS